MYKLKMKNEGITLIALVITIIVLLILAGISLSMLSGNNGIINKASQAKEQTSLAEFTEAMQLKYGEEIIESYKNGNSGNISLSYDDIKKTIAESDFFKGKDVDINGPMSDDEEYKYIITVNDSRFGIDIYGNVVEAQNGINNKYLYVTEAKEETPAYKFKNTVTQEDVDRYTGSKNTEYEIVGIALEEDGIYAQDSVEGKSGYLSIEGNIKDANFNYTLTDFFRNDEIFFLKIKIDEEYVTQKLTVVQGDLVIYEECFAGIEYAGSDWHIEEDEQFTEGKAMYTETKSNYFKIFGYCKAWNLRTVIYPENDASQYFVLTTNEDSIVQYMVGDIMTYNQEGIVCSIFRDYDEEVRKNGIYINPNSSTHKSDLFYIQLTKLATYDGSKYVDKGRLYVDAIYIYK